MKNHLIKFSALLVVFSWAGTLLANPVVSLTVGGQAPASINPGSNATFAVTLVKSGSGNLDAYLSCSNLPAGATATLSASPISFNGSTANTNSSTLKITTLPSTPAGVYTFTVIAQDGGSHNIATNTGTLTIGSEGKTVIPTHSITSIQVSPDGTASVAIHATPSKSYILQATTTLSPANWVNVSTNSTDINGDGTLIDSGASAFSSRFYRTELLN